MEERLAGGDATLQRTCGDAALAVGAAAEAATYYERALEFVATDDERVSLLGKSGEAYVRQSAFEEATTACMMQHDLLLRRGDRAAAARALTRAAGEFANGGRLQMARTVIETFLADQPEQISDQFDRTPWYASLARIATVCDDFTLAKAALAKVRDPERFRRSRIRSIAWRSYLWRSTTSTRNRGGRPRPCSVRATMRSLRWMRSQMLHSIASTSIYFAEQTVGERAVDEALAIDREFGFARAAAFAQAVKACILCVQGRLEEAAACAKAALSEPDMFVVRLELAVGASPAAILSGDDSLAKTRPDPAVFDLVREAGASSALPAMHGMEAMRLHAAGLLDDAVRLANEAADGEQHQFAAVDFWPFAARSVDAFRLARLTALCAERTSNEGDRVAAAGGFAPRPRPRGGRASRRPPDLPRWPPRATAPSPGPCTKLRR